MKPREQRARERETQLSNILCSTRGGIEAIRPDLTIVDESGTLNEIVPA